MNNRFIAKAMILALLAANAPAFAQHSHAQERRDDRREYRQEQREDRREYREERREDRREAREDRRDDRRAMRGAGPRHDLYRGGRLPANYHHRQYVVDNWRSHRLSAPPRGHHWVQVGNDYVLAAIATGIIASVLLGN
ncbi:RcnB family protein [Massilia sp. Dwa41.01b]|uniref:RcnB family protein n=1 Tax=unclassified Massilia TaxID=2609279 RepID=UPI0016019EA8|nr:MULTISPECIES: RcnB family protein [unclassified Massilia]QNA88145.1 RcnB family protein [Massilia sp. Dwa41.01b]QNA99051.1 RcnB family protein [Massilia sp. Se16.2.3]